MLYYYKRPGDWIWRRLGTRSIMAAAHEHRVSSDWRFRVEGDSTNRTLAELTEMERATQQRVSPASPDEVSLLGPDATWGYIESIICLSLIAVVLIVPAPPGAPPDIKYMLLFTGVSGLGDGVRRIRVARAWKRRHSPHQRPNHAMQRTAGRCDV